jgi:hypothetical protein
VNRACRLYGRETWSPHSPLCLAHRPSPEERAKWATKSRTAKGYGEAHKAMRKRYAAIVASGLAVCARCGRPIMPGTPWDLGHVDGGKSRYRGPEHRSCNRKAGGTQGAELTNARPRPHHQVITAKRRWSRNWNAPDPVPDYAVVLGDD